MVTIYPNYKGFIIRTIALILYIAITSMIAYYGIITNDTKDRIYLLYCIITIITYIIIGICISFFGIIKIEINKSIGQITFSRFYSKKTISISEIIGNYKSVYNTTAGTTYGCILKTKENKIIELNPGNLKDVNTIIEHLASPSIIYLGEKRSVYPFTSGL